MPDYPGWEGFLGTRASFMLDVVCLAMAAVLPAMFWGIRQAEVLRKYRLHKWFQLGLSLVLLVTVLAFEIEMRWVGWRQRALESPFFAPSGWNLVELSLWIHLFFSVSTFAIWCVVLVAAFRFFPTPAKPGAHSRFHRTWGKLAALDMTLTAVTGWIFYWLAFVASK